jgi:phosphinothricin acetyltransferase
MIRLAQSKHIKQINNIYNQAVKDGLRTAHIETVSIQEREAWLGNHSMDRYPIFVYLEDDKVLGWISISPYRSDRQALDEVVEVSYYVDYDHHGKGIASQLMEHSISFCKTASYRIMVAILVSGNEPSIGLLHKFNFSEAGRIPDAIHYKDEFRDHLFMYRKLE